MNNIRADWCLEHGGKLSGPIRSRTIIVICEGDTEDIDSRAGGVAIVDDVEILFALMKSDGVRLYDKNTNSKIKRTKTKNNNAK